MRLPQPVRALQGRIAMMVGRAIVAAVNDAAKLQTLQIEMLADEAHDAVERFQNYGMTSRPKPGAEAIAVAVGGLRSHLIVVAVDDRRFRLAGMEEGEVALYDDLGQVVHLTREGIAIRGEAVRIEADTVTIASDNIRLGGEGGAAVARVGDTVSGGVITSGSSKVRAS